MSAIEHMLSGGEERFAYQNGSEEFAQAVANLKAKFGAIDESGWYSVSTPQYNPLYNDDVVSAIIRSKPAYLDSYQPASVGRKFFMNRGWVYDKVYTFVGPNEQPLPCPEGGIPMFVGYLVNVYGQPGDADFTHFKCLYFMHKDHAQVERWAGQGLPQGRYSTFYAATFDTAKENRLLRMKTYCYDDQGGFSDWDVKWMQEAKRRGAMGSN